MLFALQAPQLNCHRKEIKRGDLPGQSALGHDVANPCGNLYKKSVNSTTGQCACGYMGELTVVRDLLIVFNGHFVELLSPYYKTGMDNLQNLLANQMKNLKVCFIILPSVLELLSCPEIQPMSRSINFYQ